MAGIDAGPVQISNTGVHRPQRLYLDIDGDDATVADQIENRCQKESAATELRTRLDYDIRPSAHQQFLINPKVEWAFQDLMAEPT
jgi:hypothetical protein